MIHEKQIREFFSSELLKHKNISDFKESDNLIETGILDSLGIMKLLIYLEEKFSIQIGDNDLIPENFETINKLLSLVEKKSVVMGGT
jgi:acyl carrier protein